jgi:hypothetical protein
VCRNSSRISQSIICSTAQRGCTGIAPVESFKAELPDKSKALQLTDTQAVPQNLERRLRIMKYEANLVQVQMF